MIMMKMNRVIFDRRNSQICIQAIRVSTAVMCYHVGHNFFLNGSVFLSRRLTCNKSVRSAGEKHKGLHFSLRQHGRI
jgi:hypothetical protein